MGANLVEIVKNKKGKIEGTVSIDVGQLSYKDMRDLREQVCMVVAEMEQIWKDNQ